MLITLNTGMVLFFWLDFTWYHTLTRPSVVVLVSHEPHGNSCPVMYYLREMPVAEKCISCPYNDSSCPAGSKSSEIVTYSQKIGISVYCWSKWIFIRCCCPISGQTFHGHRWDNDFAALDRQVNMRIQSSLFLFPSKGSLASPPQRTWPLSPYKFYQVFRQLICKAEQNVIVALARTFPFMDIQYCGCGATFATGLMSR